MTAKGQDAIGHSARIEPHDPALYQPAGTAAMLPDLDAVDAGAAAFYAEHGYLAIEQALTPDEVAQSIRVLNDLICGERAGQFQAVYEAGVDPVTLLPQQRLDKVRKLAFYNRAKTPGTENATLQCGLPVMHAGLLRIVKLLMGGQEPVPFQIMTLLKPPQGGREKPWHQDHAYFDLEIDDRIVGIWIALDQATVDNGCMQLLDGGHRLGPIHHWKRRDWQICDTQVTGKPSLAVPLPPGGALFFDSLLPHGTPTNHSPHRRRAMQLHYAPANARPTSAEARMAIFGTEGKDVTC